MRPTGHWIVFSLALVSPAKSFSLQDGFKNFQRHISLQSTREDESSMKDYSVHLYSLKWSSLEDETGFSKIVRDTWRWKDEVLGDGRDFFVPRPKTLRALQEYILQNSVELGESGRFVECVLLSNCARFEIILLTRDKEGTLESLAEGFVAQVKSFQNLSFKQLQLSFDRSGNIDRLAKIEEADRRLVTELAEDRHWIHLEGTEKVCRHLCMIAAGMADRPSRPGRPVPFQPFSSRDAHVLLQLKRTLENTRSAPRIALLLRYALLAGKTVRNPDKIEELQTLRQYGTGNTKYDSTPPPHVLEEVTQVSNQGWSFLTIPNHFLYVILQIAIRKGIDPIVEECVNAWMALDTGKDVSSFRESALRLALNENERKWVMKKLHEPTLQLRKGMQLDRDSFLKDLQSDLVALFR